MFLLRFAQWQEQAERELPVLPLTGRGQAVEADLVGLHPCPLHLLQKP